MENSKTISIVCYTVIATAAIVSTGCAKPPETRVNPKEQCFHFKVEGQPKGCDNGSYSTFHILRETVEKCGAIVHMAYDKEEFVPCADVVSPERKVKGKDLKEYKIVSPHGNGSGNRLTDVINPDSKCGITWIRFEDENGCNSRCYVSGGRAYCR